MRNENAANIASLVADVAKFYRHDVSEFTLQVWLDAMAVFEFSQVRRAFSAHLANPENGQFMPKPADIVRILQGTPTERAALAWGKAFEAMKTVGAYQHVCFDDPAIHAAISDMGGWIKVCRSETKDISYLMHRFCEIHKSYTGRGEFQYPSMLIGDMSSDDEFLKKGLPAPKPVLIGDPAKAMRVAEIGSKTGKTQITAASDWLRLEAA